MTWSGIFWGDDVLEQAQQVNAPRAAGQPLAITVVLTQTPDNSQSMQGVDSLVSSDLAMGMAIINRNVNQNVERLCEPAIGLG